MENQAGVSELFVPQSFVWVNPLGPGTQGQHGSKPGSPSVGGECLGGGGVGADLGMGVPLSPCAILNLDIK